MTARSFPQLAFPGSPARRCAARLACVRSRWLRIAVAALINCFAMAAASAADMPSVTVDVEHQGDTYVVVATVLAPVTPSAAWAVLTDFDHMTDFMPTLTASRVLKRVDNNVLVQQSGKMELGTFRMPFESQRMVELAPPTTIHSRQLRGNMQRVDSTTTFSEAPGGTRIDYRVEIVPKLWMPETIAGPLLRTEVDRQFNAILKELIRRNTQ